MPTPNVPRNAITDGMVCYAADIDQGTLRDRVFVSLDRVAEPFELWWLSVHGIYRPRPEAADTAWRLLPYTTSDVPAETDTMVSASLLHPKYQLPAWCFSYVGNASQPKTRKLPYRKIDGSLDKRRLPKAIQAILSNYRGTKVGGIPDAAIPQVLLTLARAAAEQGMIPPYAINPSPVYQQLATALNTLGVDRQWEE